MARLSVRAGRSAIGDRDAGSLDVVAAAGAALKERQELAELDLPGGGYLLGRGGDAERVGFDRAVVGLEEVPSVDVQDPEAVDEGACPEHVGVHRAHRLVREVLLPRELVLAGAASLGVETPAECEVDVVTVDRPEGVLVDLDVVAIGAPEVRELVAERGPAFPSAVPFGGIGVAEDVVNLLQVLVASGLSWSM